MAKRTAQYFLSRPRRFGKSLLLSTLKELFSGDRSLFAGLWIETYLGEVEQRRVLHISFNTLSYRELGLQQAILQELRFIAADNDIETEARGIPSVFQEIIRKQALSTTSGSKPVRLLFS